MMAANHHRTGPIVLDGRTIGVHLEPANVGQHYMGVDPLLRRMGAAPADPHGIRSFDDHLCRTVPRWSHREMEHEERLHLDVGPRARKLKSVSSILCVEGNIDHAVDETVRYSPLTIVTGAWDDSAFAVRGYGEEGMAIVALLKEGIERLDLVVWISDGIDLGPGHLCIARRSMIPPERVKQFDDQVSDLRRLHEAADATGIARRLTAIGRYTPFGRMLPYYALSPAWVGPEHEDATAHPVRFFLNPTDQSANNFGWFTVEQLDQWIDGRGPIPKNPAKEEA